MKDKYLLCLNIPHPIWSHRPNSRYIEKMPKIASFSQKLKKNGCPEMKKNHINMCNTSF